jgi:DnaK suppressor protein
MSATMMATRKSVTTLMSAQRRRQVERELQTQRIVLLRAAHDELLRGEQQPFASIAGEVPDVGDQATATALTDFDNEIARRHDEAIREIDAALLRLQDPEFGGCADCGGEIGFERLMAFPTATRCITCQSQHEKTYASLATPTM